MKSVFVGGKYRVLFCSCEIILIPKPHLLLFAFVCPFTALANLDSGLRGPYWEAWDLEPELVQQESPKIDFLRTEDFDVVKAATRLAWYWKYRKQLFGNRWLLPMTLTGTGALNSDDLETLRSGYFIGHYDPARGAIFIQDNSRLRVYDDSICRCSFYWAKLYGKEASQTKGVYLIHVVSSAPKPTIDIQTKTWDLVIRAMPCRFKGLSVLKSYEEAKQLLVDYMAFEASRLIRHASGGRPVELLESGSAESDLRLLESRGIPRTVIPNAFFGGSYNYSEFDNFIRARVSLESIMAAAPPILNTSLWQQQQPQAIAQPSFAMQEALVARPRKRQAVEESQRPTVYSRRYNHKKRQEELSLKDSHRLLSDENKSLRQEHVRLEQLLAQAKTLLLSYGIHQVSPESFPVTTPFLPSDDFNGIQVISEGRPAKTRFGFDSSFGVVQDETSPPRTSPFGSHGMDRFFLPPQNSF